LFLYSRGWLTSRGTNLVSHQSRANASVVMKRLQPTDVKRLGFQPLIG
jgi:hypothetical protein